MKTTFVLFLLVFCAHASAAAPTKHKTKTTAKIKVSAPKVQLKLAKKPTPRKPVVTKTTSKTRTKTRSKSKAKPKPATTPRPQIVKINPTEIIYRLTRWASYAIVTPQSRAPAFAIGRNLFASSLSKVNIFDAQPKSFKVESSQGQSLASLVAIDVQNDLAIFHSNVIASYPLQLSSLPINVGPAESISVAILNSNNSVQLSEASANALPILSNNQLGVMFNSQQKPLGLLLQVGGFPISISGSVLVQLMSNTQAIDGQAEYKRQIVPVTHSYISSLRIPQSLSCKGPDSETTVCTGPKTYWLNSKDRVGEVSYGSSAVSTKGQLNLRSKEAEKIILDSDANLRIQFEALANNTPMYKPAACKQRYVSPARKKLYLVTSCLSESIKIPGLYLAGIQFVSSHSKELKTSYLLLNGFELTDIKNSVSALLSRAGGPHGR